MAKSITRKHLGADKKDFKEIKEEAREVIKEVNKLTSRDKKVKGK